jgi:hypothetical protein
MILHSRKNQFYSTFNVRHIKMENIMVVVMVVMVASYGKIE